MGEPKYIKNSKYKYKKNGKHTEGIWIGYDGKPIPPGWGDFDRKNRTVTQYNTDGTKSVYSWEQWHHKNTKDHETRVLQNDRKWAIPYIPEKEMTITIDDDYKTRRNEGATFSENVLDSIAVNAKRAGLPFSTGLALASQESTIGHHKERTHGKSLLPWLRVLNSENDAYKKEAKDISYNGYYSPSLLVSNWTQRDENPFAKFEYEDGYLRTTPLSTDYYDEYYNPQVRKNNRYTFNNESPLQNAFEFYRTSPQKYNSGNSDYPKEVEENRQELLHSPEIRDYMQKNGLHAEGGNLKRKDWNSLSLKDKSDIIKVAISNGIVTLPEIREAYNKFAEGEDITDEQYYSTMERVAKENNPKWNAFRREEGLRELSEDEEYLRILNDNSFDYRGYYNKHPQSAANADTHWDDEFKTVYHPSFSNESRYSPNNPNYVGKSQYNPNEIPGGYWIGEQHFPTISQQLEEQKRDFRRNIFAEGGPLMRIANI